MTEKLTVRTLEMPEATERVLLVTDDALSAIQMATQEVGRQCGRSFEVDNTWADPDCNTVVAQFTLAHKTPSIRRTVVVEIIRDPASPRWRNK